ncbi:MAG TPA: DNA ligase D [Geminicoccaceae bacterium]|nr:DNA ligase D [Geminicoccaceae bacterium]
MAVAEDVTADALQRYRAKRDFRKTAEPPGGKVAPGTSVFVVQKHAARRLHYDLRLQFGDTLKSWAVPQGPSLDPKVRRLAVHTEDHPLEYADFEELIPKGQYGAGGMIVWDRGSWIAMGDPQADYRKGTLKFRLSGEKLGGGWTLVRLKPKEGERGDNWLLIKERDPYARPGEGDRLLEERPESVLSGRRVEELLEPDEPSAPAPAARKARRIRPSALAGAVKAALPDQVRPQLATPAARVPEGEEWLHEIKLDGYRTLARIDAGAVRLLTRTGQDWTGRYGLLAKAFGALPCKQALVDGEIVVQGADGIANFAALQDALAEGRTHELTCFAFDLLHLDGYDLTAVPLIERKAALAALLEPVVGPSSALQLSDHVQGNGRAFFEQASRLGLEGVISKRADAPYQQTRTRSWLKVKCRLSEEFPIVGYNPSEAAGGIGALLLAAPEDGGLRYVGRVGTGFSMAEMKRLHARLDGLRTRTPPVALPPEERRKGIVWVRPALAAEVEFGNRTADGILRHAVYKGLRADKAEAEAPAKAAEPVPVVERKRYVTDADLAQVWVTNPDRVMFGKGGPTKLELALYYARVADWMLPELIRRPVSLVRCPLGRIEDCFFQRHARPGMPDAVRTIALTEEGKKEKADYLYVEDAKGLLSLAQFGTIEFHSWGCRVDQPERPDRLVFDLDPDESLPWREVANAAFEVKDALTAEGLVPFLKTTGGKGLHLVVPIQRRRSWDEVAAFCEAFARQMAAQFPGRYTANMAKAQRRGRIYLDYLRNQRSATAVAAYSLRARPGAPASTPLAWEELRRLDDPADLNYASVPERLASGLVDPWAGIEQSARPLPKVTGPKRAKRA